MTRKVLRTEAAASSDLSTQREAALEERRARGATSKRSADQTMRALAKRWGRWLPERADRLPWAERCGYEIEHGDWTPEDACTFDYTWSYLPIELLAVVLHRSPAQVAERMRASGNEPEWCGTGQAWRGPPYADTDEQGRRKRDLPRRRVDISDEVLEIIGVPAHGLTLSELGALLGVSRQRVSVLVRSCWPRPLHSAETRARERAPVVLAPADAWKVFVRQSGG